MAGALGPLVAGALGPLLAEALEADGPLGVETAVVSFELVDVLVVGNN